tara:strand:+ start:230 stop:853 length:624 start_codon:yes stop_codon:yes gene_type:complete
MTNIITFFPQKIKARGLNKEDFPNEEKIKEHFFLDDYNKLNLLNNIKLNLTTITPRLLYPGCGCDILFPLIYLEKLFPKIKVANFIFVDSSNNLPNIKTILDSVGVGFSEDKNKISFYWKNIFVNLTFVNMRIEDIFQQIKPIDIYFERAFRIMRERIVGYEKVIVEKLNPSGILISDSGFTEQNLQFIEVLKKLSSYEEMVIGVKK